MSAPTYGYIFKEGLWHNNTGLVQLLGLCPLLAVSTNVVNGLGLGLATMLVLTATNFAISTIRDFARSELRIPVFVLVIAALVTAVQLLINAYFHDLYNVLGIFIPLIVTNCAVIGRAEAFASKHDPLRAAIDGFAIGLGFAIVLMVLGGIRELLGQGTLFSDAHLMLGESWRAIELQFWEGGEGVLLAILPPGAFFALGGLIACKNLIDAHRKKHTIAPPSPNNAAKTAAYAKAVS
ncbi:MAG: electron transport complex subunit E [Gammaproteobacteria bacterium]|nr:electron transport complex subunit E [Gammaproteobacteria bacterium]